MAIPEGHCGQIVERSGLANLCGIIVHNETIDSDYPGVVCVVVSNLSDGGYTAESGNYIAQLIIELCFMPNFVNVSKFMEEKIE